MFISIVTLISLCGLAWSFVAGAKASDLRSAVQNPISSLISLPFKFIYDTGADNGDAHMVNIMPVVPVSFGDWNLVNRLIASIGHVDGHIAGLPGNPSPVKGDGAEGLGDLNYSAFLSPAKVDKLIWGAGLSLGMPTASDDQLGSGKWTTGPTESGRQGQLPWFWDSPNGAPLGFWPDSSGLLRGTETEMMSVSSS